MKIEMDLYAQIRRLYKEGESQRSIAKKLGISRQTVKKYCEGATTPEVRKNYKRTNHIITDDVKAFILEYFQTDEQEHVKKQNHTAKRIYDRLTHEKSYTGSYSAICKAVRELKPNIEPSQADIRC